MQEITAANDYQELRWVLSSLPEVWIQINSTVGSLLLSEEVLRKLLSDLDEARSKLEDDKGKTGN